MKDLICIIPICCFDKSKSRLSNFLSDDERVELMKSMLKDIVTAIRDNVEEIILVSGDDEVYEYAQELGISFVRESEHENNKLNRAITDAVVSVKENYGNVDILVLPGDIPMIKKEHIISVKSAASDLVISPSHGGGTNLLCFNSDFDYETFFGDMSYFRHIQEAYAKDMTVNVIESFYLSIDVNTPQDLGEILLHAIGTNTYDYLTGLNITVKSKHGQERLDVKRIDE
jgi:2-phospho-L-lactate guanylyltransferase